jgi:small subunit ribosomal protein S8
MTDPIADMITRIKNAVLSRHQTVSMPHSKMKEALARLLVESGYIDSVDVVKQSPRDELVVTLKYVGRVPAITNVRRISKPGRRMYSSVMQIPRSLGGYGLTIVSTNKGIMSDKQARQQNVGGEVICQIW